MSNLSTRVFSIFFIRTLLGIILLMQGYGKVITYTVPKVYDLYFKDFETTFLPTLIIWVTAYFTSYVELIGGLLLIIGFFRKYALYLIAVDLLIVSFGHGLKEPIWDLSHVMPRSLLLIMLLLAPQNWDQLNLDRFINKKP